MRFREKHLYGYMFHPPEYSRLLRRYVPIVIIDWPNIPVRERFFKDRPYYYRYGGQLKPWNKEISDE